MSKLLVVFGVTGQQGGSAANFVINDPELSKQFKVRGVTRDPSKPDAQALKQKGIEVVQGDLDDNSSVERAVQGADTVFGVTLTIYDREKQHIEVAQGKAIADASVAAGAKYLIWSTVPSGAKISNGKLPHAADFEEKAEVADYIRTLPIKSAFFAPSCFMQNFIGSMAPRPAGDGTYAMSNVWAPTSEIPLIDIADTGKWVGAVLAEPEKYEGENFAAATKLYTMEEVTQTISELTGKTVLYKQLPDEVFKGFFPPAFNEEMLQMFQLMRDYGYHGPEQRKLVTWSAEQARGKLTSVEEFFQKNPLKLE